MQYSFAHVPSRIHLGALGLALSAAGLATTVDPLPPAASAAPEPAVDLILGPLVPYESGSSFESDAVLEGVTVQLDQLSQRLGPLPDDDPALVAMLSLLFADVDLGESDGDPPQDDYYYVWRLIDGDWIQFCVRKREAVLGDPSLPEPLRLELTWSMPL